MGYRKKTLRKLPEVTREYCKLINDLQGILKRAKNLAERIESLELDSKALANAKAGGPGFSATMVDFGHLEKGELGRAPADYPVTECPACREVLKQTGKLPDYCSSCGWDRRSVQKAADQRQAEFENVSPSVDTDNDCAP